MQKDNKFFEDIAKLASGAAGGLLDAKREFDEMVRHQVEKFMQRMNLVSREEFDTVMGMLAKAREEQEALKKRLDQLEQKK